MDAILRKCLASHTVRSFVFKREPEGKLPDDALQNSITYSYEGGQSAARIQPPHITETFVPHLCADGFAMGETLGISHYHPIVPILKAASRADNLFVEVRARRFVATLNAENIIDTLEFSWMDDGRLLVCYRSTNLGQSSAWMHNLETRLYAPPEDKDEFPTRVELRMAVCDTTPSKCPVCIWRDPNKCSCASSMTERLARWRASQKVTPHTWQNYMLLFHKLNRLGKLNVKYFATSSGTERQVHGGEVLYRINTYPNFQNESVRRRQLQIYHIASRNLTASPLTDKLLQECESDHKFKSESSCNLSFESESGVAYQDVDNESDITKAQVTNEGFMVVDTSQDHDDMIEIDTKVLNSSPFSSNDSQEEPNSFICRVCGATFEDMPTFVQHKVAMHEPEKFHTCLRCSTSFDTVSELRKHEILVHNKSAKPYCVLCDRNFRLNQSLELHVQTVHNQEKPFICTVCKTSFARKSSLTRHTRSVHMAQRYICSEPGCNARYAQPFDLKRHMLKKGHGEILADPSRRASYEVTVVSDGTVRTTVRELAAARAVRY